MDAPGDCVFKRLIHDLFGLFHFPVKTSPAVQYICKGTVQVYDSSSRISLSVLLRAEGVSTSSESDQLLYETTSLMI